MRTCTSALKNVILMAPNFIRFNSKVIYGQIWIPVKSVESRTLWYPVPVMVLPVRFYPDRSFETKAFSRSCFVLTK